MAAKYEIFEDRASQYRFRLKAGNGEIILVSEGYTQKSNCKNGIESVRENSRRADHFKYWKNDSKGHFWFTLIAENGKTIGTSETYTTSQASHRGADSVKTNAPSAPAYDLTD